MRLVWANDLHLNMAEAPAIDAFVAVVRANEPDAVLLGGDTGMAGSVSRYLTDLAGRIGRPVYFVLGNHDYYAGSIAEVRDNVRALCNGNDLLHWLPDEGIVRLADSEGLIGHGCWGDARAASFLESTMRLNDYVFIEELSGISQTERMARLNALGDEAAAHLREFLPGALERFEHVHLLAHVPPFLAASFHKGRPCDDDAAPHFCCVTAGEALVEIMSERRDRRLTVLSGHTHGSGEVDILPNLRCLTGGARYRRPAIQRVIEMRSPMSGLGEDSGTGREERS